MNEIEVHRLAVLAALLDPGLCKTEPVKAIKQARGLLTAVRLECRTKEERLAQEEGEKFFDTPVAYNVAVKKITGEHLKKNPKFYRAKGRFVKFWAFRCGITDAEAKRQLREYEDGKKSFTEEDVHFLPRYYSEWESQPKKRKGKQGRRKSKYDGRVGIAPHGRIAETIPELRHGWRLTPKNPRT